MHMVVHIPSFRTLPSQIYCFDCIVVQDTLLTLYFLFTYFYNIAYCRRVIGAEDRIVHVGEDGLRRRSSKTLVQDVWFVEACGRLVPSERANQTRRKVITL